MAALIGRLSKTTKSAIFGTHSTISPTSFISLRCIVSRLFVGGLSFHTTEKTLSDTFTQYGQVMEAKIIHDRVSERSKGFGFVTYASTDEADKALNEMNGKQLDGRVIFVGQAKPKVDFGRGGVIARGPPDDAVDTQ